MTTTMIAAIGERPLPTLIVTRPEPQAADWVARLQALGATATALPLLRIEAAPEAAQTLAQTWRELAAWRLLMFVSPNAVAQFVAARPAGALWPAGVLAGATGPGTVAALRAAGVPAGQIAAPHADAASFDAEALWRDALVSLDWATQRVLVLRGDGGRDWLADTLSRHGAQVSMLCAYRQLGPAWTPAEQALLQILLNRPADHIWLFSSSQSVRHLLAAVDGAAPSPGADPDAGPAQALRRMAAIATHERIADTARGAGLAPVATCAPRPAAVLDALRHIVSGVTRSRR
jgi:uroporphyrinogen-III synthase